MKEDIKILNLVLLLILNYVGIVITITTFVLYFTHSEAYQNTSFLTFSLFLQTTIFCIFYYIFSIDKIKYVN